MKERWYYPIGRFIVYSLALWTGFVATILFWVLDKLKERG